MTVTSVRNKKWKNHSHFTLLILLEFDLSSVFTGLLGLFNDAS